MTESLQATELSNTMQQAVALAEVTAKRWAQEANKYSNGRAAELLAGVLEDPDGLDFTVEFVDGVIRPEDIRVAAKNLAQLTKKSPDFLPPWLRIPARVGGVVGYLAPEIVVPAARKVFSELVGDLVLDVSDKSLAPAVSNLRADGSKLNINLLGEAVLGDTEADRRLADTFELLRRDDVDYVSLKVSAVTGPHSPWDHQKIVEQAVERLLPLYQYAATSPSPKFINLDMEEYHDLDLTIDVFKQLLDREELKNLPAGIVIQSYLPDALAALKDLQQWSAERVARGGVPIKVRLVKGANLAMERVQAEIHGWPLATWESKQATDANYLRILDWALRPEHTDSVRLGVAGHNLFSLATAWELAGLRGVRESIDFEMLAGMASSQAQAIREDVGNLLLYVPVVRPQEFDVAIAYLVRRLEENSAPENFMSSIFDIGTDSAAFDREKNRFRAAAKQMSGEGDRRCHPSRTQNRLEETPEQIEALLRSPGGGWQFINTPDTDPSLAANRQWAQQIASKISKSQLGNQEIADNQIFTKEQLDKRIKKALKAAKKWQKLPASERSDILHRVGVQLAVHRAELVEVAASELGKGIGQSDPEISEAIDFAHYYAEQALELEQIRGGKFVPANLTVVTPPWNFPLSIPLGGVTAALAAGTAVILKPSSVASRCGAVLAQCLWDAGVDPDLFQFLPIVEGQVSRQLIEDPRVDRVVLTGSSETAEMFLDWRPDLNLLAETSGKNSIIVTPSADLDLAVKDVVESAFGHAGQKCSAASVVILVGSVATSKRFHDQLLDAVKSLQVKWPIDLSQEMGPLSAVPGEKLKQGLKRLEPGQRWALRPEQLDLSEKLWSPGIRSGVEVGSEFQQIEYFGPILGVIQADTLEEAVAIQNSTVYGLTAGIQSLAVDEVKYWLDNVDAGNLYVNRSITGAIVRRQPFGGWRMSSVGAGAKAGGPNYLFGFGDLLPADEPVGKVGGKAFPKVPERDLHVTKTQLADLVKVARLVLPAEEAARVERAAYNAERACQVEFDQLNDPSGLRSERNVLRYIPTRAVLRAAEGVPLVDLLCVAAAAVSVGEYREVDGRLVRFAAGNMPLWEWDGPNLVLSTAEPLPPAVYAWAEDYGFGCMTQPEDEFEANLLSAAWDFDGRVRLLGRSRADLAKTLGASISYSIWDGPATTAGRVEVIPFVHEQAISITAHRFGTVGQLANEVLKS